MLQGYSLFIGVFDVLQAWALCLFNKFSRPACREASEAFDSLDFSHSLDLDGFGQYRRVCIKHIKYSPKTNSLPLKMDGWKIIYFPFGFPPVFRDYCMLVLDGFREGKKVQGFVWGGHLTFESTSR